MSDYSGLLKTIEKHRASGAPLRDQLLWRIRSLAGEDLADPVVRSAFAEVVDAFEPPGCSLELLGERCAIDRSDGGSVRVGGLLAVGRTKVGFLQRRLMLGQGYAIHETLYLDSGARGKGISVISLAHSFAFYDAINLDRVYLRAALATGRWHWARVGFEFVLDSDREAVREWTAKALRALGITDLRIDRFTSTAQFARLGGARKVSLDELAVALPSRRAHIRSVAKGNDIQPTDQIELSRALMLTGPEWYGVLELRGPGRQAFNAYAAGKVQRLER